jgi:integrase
VTQNDGILGFLVRLDLLEPVAILRPYRVKPLGSIAAFRRAFRIHLLAQKPAVPLAYAGDPAAYGDKIIAQIGTADLEGFLAGLNVAAETRNSYRRNIHTLWSFAEKRGWATSAIAGHTERAKAIARPPGILAPGQATALLAESKDDDLLCLHCLGLFAGLRVAEIKALDWQDVDLAGGFIHVGAKISKTRARRLVPVLPNLKAWLQPIAKPAGPVVERELRYRHEAAWGAIEIKPAYCE